MSERIALGVSYDGTHYQGWQYQPQHLTVQSVLEQAISNMGVYPEDAKVVPAGRTDKGVHALNQVVHFDAHKLRPADVWLKGLNAHLPLDVRVHWVKKVTNEFHARFSAKYRHYQYLISNQAIAIPHLQRIVTWYPFKIDLEAMQAGADYLLGEHDFSAFRGAHCQSKTPVRRILEVQFSQSQQLIKLDIKANAFLHHMVRNIVGTLLLVGRGKHPPHWIQEVLSSRDRRKAGFTAPPQGLYFLNVVYDAKFELPNSCRSALSNVLKTVIIPEF